MTLGERRGMGSKRTRRLVPAAAALLLGVALLPVGAGVLSPVAAEEKVQADCTIVGTQGDDVLKGGPGRGRHLRARW